MRPDKSSNPIAPPHLPPLPRPVFDHCCLSAQIVDKRSSRSILRSSESFAPCALSCEWAVEATLSVNVFLLLYFLFPTVAPQSREHKQSKNQTEGLQRVARLDVVQTALVADQTQK